MVVWYEVGFGTEVDWPIRCEAEHVYVTSSNRLRFNICSSWQTETESLCCAKGEEEFFSQTHHKHKQPKRIAADFGEREDCTRENEDKSHSSSGSAGGGGVEDKPGLRTSSQPAKHRSSSRHNITDRHDRVTPTSDSARL